MVTVDVPIRDLKKPLAVKFPDRCVYCGKPKARVLPLNLNTGAQKRGQIIQIELSVPLCEECGAREDRIANVTWLPFFIVGFLACLVVFVPVWLVTPEGQTSQTVGFPIVFGAFVGMAAGIVVGTLVEFALKYLFAPSYGQLLLKRPVTIFSIFNDSENVIGLAVKFTDQRKMLRLMFENDDIGEEFKTLNSQEK